MSLLAFNFTCLYKVDILRFYYFCGKILFGMQCMRFL